MYRQRGRTEKKSSIRNLPHDLVMVLMQKKKMEKRRKSGFHGL